MRRSKEGEKGSEGWNGGSRDWASGRSKTEEQKEAVREFRCLRLCARCSCTVFFKINLRENSHILYEFCPKMGKTDWSPVSGKNWRFNLFENSVTWCLHVRK